jgi:hypothetical protein
MKGLVLLVAVLTLVTFASGVMAQQTPATKPAAPTPAAPEKAKGAPAAPEKANVAKEERFIGKVSSMDVASKTVVVKNPEAEKTFTVGDKTKITRGKKEMALVDLKQKMDVSVSYKMEAGKAMAAAITVHLPKTKPTAKATPEKTVVKPSETPEE